MWKIINEEKEENKTYNQQSLFSHYSLSILIKYELYKKKSIIIFNTAFYFYLGI